MQTLRTTLLLTAFLIMPHAVTAQGIAEDTEDEFSGARRVVTEAVTLEAEEPSTEAYARAVWGADTYVLLIDLHADTWQALSARTAYVRADAGTEPVRLQVDVMRVDSEVRGGSTYERIALVLTRSEAERLQRSQDVRMRISGTVYVAPAALQQNIAALLDRVQ